MRQESTLNPVFADDIQIDSKCRAQRTLLERQNNSGNKTFAGTMKHNLYHFELVPSFVSLKGYDFKFADWYVDIARVSIPVCFHLSYFKESLVSLTGQLTTAVFK